MAMGWRVLLVAMLGGCCVSGFRPTTSPECAATIAAAVRGDTAALGGAAPELLRCRDADGFEPIHHAAHDGSTETVAWLLDHGVPIEVPGARERTPFYWACSAGNLEVARMLLDRGANIEARNNTGHTPWISAAEQGEMQVLELLLERGADTRATTNYGADSVYQFVPFVSGHGVTREESVAMLVWLLEHGGEVDLHDRVGWTAVHAAARDGQVELMRVLLDRGANPNIITESGSTPLDVATYNGRPEVVALLRERGGRSSDDATMVGPPALTASYRLPGSVIHGAGARPAPLGTRCTVVVRPMAEASTSFNCQLAVDCDGGGHLYGGAGIGAMFCDLSTGSLRAFDPWPTPNDGDPSAELDVANRRFVVDDGLPGRDGTRVTLLLDDPAAPAGAPAPPAAPAP